jgi:hypothetical protein
MGAIHQALLGARGSGGDPHFASVVLLVPWNGVDGATTETDLSNSGHALTFVNQAQIDTAQSLFGGSSLLLDGNQDRVTAPDSADWGFAAGDWTLEQFFRPNSFAAETDQVLLSHYSATGNQRSWIWRISATVMEFVYSVDGTATVTISGAFTFSTGTWYYGAAKRSGTSLILYAAAAADPTTTVVQTGAVAADSLFNSTTTLRIGSVSSGGIEDQEFAGWMNQTRITKGVARNVSNVPTAPFPTS